MSDYKYAYKIQYEIIPVLHHDGFTFPDLSVKYYRRNRIYSVNSPVFSDLRHSRTKHSKCRFAVRDPDQFDPVWVTIPQHPIDIFAHRMYPGMYTEEPLEKMSYYQRIKIFNDIIRGYFSNNMQNYVKAVVRDFLLMRYANLLDEKTIETAAKKWYTKAPVEGDVCVAYTDYAVRLARAHCPDFTRTIIKEGVIDVDAHEIIDNQEDADYKTYVWSTRDKEVSIIEEDILQPLRSGIAVARNRQPKDRPVPDN